MIYIPVRLKESLKKGECVLFVGSGLSRGLPQWRELIKPLADELGVNMDKDPRIIASWYEKEFKRSKLEKKITSQLKKDVSLTEIHKILAQLPLKAIVTTNYDQLLEKALSKRTVARIIYDEEAPLVGEDQLPLVKMHGDLDDPSTMVITKRDYDEYAETHRALITYLQGLLISCNFLFVGFSLEDPNFDNIYMQIKSLFRESKRMSYVILKNPPEFEIKRLQEDMGIEVIPIKDYDEILDIFAELIIICREKRIKTEMGTQNTFYNIIEKQYELFSIIAEALLYGNKYIPVLSIAKSDGSYRVSVQGTEDQFRPVKESREVFFPLETKKELIEKIELLIKIINLSSTSSIERSLSYVDKVLREAGIAIYESFIPEDFSSILRAEFLLLEVEDTEIPWELMYSDDFFALKYAVSRRIVAAESVITRRRRSKKRRALVISDPTKNLPGAKLECEIIYERLKRKMEVVFIEGCDANMRRIVYYLDQGFDIIHFAGHVDNALVLSDGIMTAEDIKEHIAGTPVVVVNGCKSEELARAFLLGGAKAYVGTIHPVHDRSAAEFAADFYELSLKHRGGEALRKAREYHIGKDLVWASFVMYGDPTLKLL